jgi:hypothetical protein
LRSLKPSKIASQQASQAAVIEQRVELRNALNVLLNGPRPGPNLKSEPPYPTIRHHPSPRIYRHRS